MSLRLAFFNEGSSQRHSIMCERRLVFNNCWICKVENSSSEPNLPKPALQMTVFSAFSKFDKSTLYVSTLEGSGSCEVDGLFGLSVVFVSKREMPTTWCPASSSFLQTAAPMPRLAPATSIFRFKLGHSGAWIDAGKKPCGVDMFENFIRAKVHHVVFQRLCVTDHR